MIKINLLPVPKARKIKKATEVQYELVLGGVIIGVVLLGCFYFWSVLNGRIARMQDQKGQATKTLNDLKALVKEVENYESNKKTLQEKNEVIEQLKKNQSVPVRLLDNLSRSLDPLKIWLNNISAQGIQVDIDGKAITNSDIVELINRLKDSKMFSDVQLIESRQAFEANIPIYNFKLRCSMAS